MINRLTDMHVSVTLGPEFVAHIHYTTNSIMRHHFGPDEGHVADVPHDSLLTLPQILSSPAYKSVVG